MKGSLQLPTGIKQTGSLPRRRSRGSWYSFWTPERDTKLLYVWDTYGDLDKAVRVMGVSKQIIMMRLAHHGRNAYR